MINKKYYHKINNLDIALKETNHKYIMIYQWAKDFSHKWGIAGFYYDDEENYWYLRTYGNFNYKNIDMYDFGTLVRLGFRWIENGIFDKEVSD